jgi:hypothetical protein
LLLLLWTCSSASRMLHQEDCLGLRAVLRLPAACIRDCAFTVLQLRHHIR